MKTVKLDKWPSAQMQPMNDTARARTVLNTPVPDYLWEAMTKASAAICDIGEVFEYRPMSVFEAYGADTTTSIHQVTLTATEHGSVPQ